MSRAFKTRCIYGDADAALQDERRAISFPICQTTSFGHIRVGHNDSGFDYSRESNPTRRRLEEIVTSFRRRIKGGFMPRGKKRDGGLFS